MAPLNDSRQVLDRAKRLVVKIGSALLVEAEQGVIREDWLTALTEDVARLHHAGKEVLLVSSGAIAVGRGGGLLLLELEATGRRQ